MQTAWVYTIASNSWDIANITAASGNVYPSSRSDHTAVVSKFITYYLFILIFIVRLSHLCIFFN
jgi:hypothetical protein